MAIDINGDGLIQLGGTSTTQGRVRLNEDTDNGTNYIELTAPASVTANRTITLPDVDGTMLTSGTTVTVAQGGTGATTLTAEAVIIGNTTSAVKFVSPGTNGNVLTSNGTAWISTALPAGGVTSFNTRTGAVTLTTSDVTTATAGVTAGSVGTYMNASSTNNTAFNSTAAGSTLTPACIRVDSNITAGSAQSGTWKCMGTSTSSSNNMTLWLRTV